MKKIMFSLIGILLAFSALPAGAYNCCKEADVLDRMRDADAVFLGEVVQIDLIGKAEDELGTERMKVLFLASKVWKGVSADDGYVNVDTEALYEYNFARGQEYLVFAYKLYGDGRLSIVGCPRVRPASEAAKDIEDLGEPKVIIKK